MIKILTNAWGETLSPTLEKYLHGYTFLFLSKWYTYSEFTSFYHLGRVVRTIDVDIVHMQAWSDIYLFKKQKGKKFIFHSHGVHPGLSLIWTLYITESFLKKVLITLLYPILKFLFTLQVRRVDLYFVSIPGILPLAKSYGAHWLPNPIDTELFQKGESSFPLDTDCINVFYPTSLRTVKNPDFAFDLFRKIIAKYKNVRIYMIRQSVSNYKKYHHQLEEIEAHIIWIEQIERKNFPYYYSAPWDLVVGSFSPTRVYAVLNMIELEAMACSAPIIAHDIYEVIQVPLDDIEGLAYKLIENQTFRDEYTKKNREYIEMIHSGESVARLYEQYISKL